MIIKILNGLIAMVAGVGGAVLLFIVMNALVERLSSKWEQRIKPYVFIGPAVAVVGLFLVFPALRSFYLSFFDAAGDRFVGADNYQTLFDEGPIRTAIWNNFKWIIVVPAACVVIGLFVATLADRLKPRWESVSKSVIFLPMAISAVGASTIWGFVYAFRAEGRPQIGLLNQIVTAFGASPVAWLQERLINDYMLMLVFIWLQAGFAMVLLSAALKNVPEDTIEAARVDGASQRQIFFRVIVPQMMPTIVVVFTTVLIGVLKVFDVVRVMTNGNFGTEVIANRFISEIFTFREFGRAAAIVVVLVVATIPVMVLNIKRFRQMEST
ncbi:carbohydrate ABC transporter permease [Nitriliruptor alkaliphilus]|uniref:carbohydrate ABC transporter permease n=1 Tax=Nitriliruptor alkaliphilus TaxID=427918 RepID=UPI000AD3E83F|nr:sugar ABC transporter permease [Nitriliruptor alkaliphilus]